jgi:hypothetical protein
MANAIKKYDNGLSIRYIKKSKAYFITFGVTHIQVNGTYLKGFNSFQEAEDFLNTLKPMPYTSYSWSV